MEDNVTSNIYLYDFFISYAVENWKQAKWVGLQLENYGYRTALAGRDFSGGNFVLKIDNALKTSAAMIAIISPDYLASPWCQAEWSAVYPDDPTGEQGLLIPVFIQNCETKGLLRPLLRVNLIDLIGKDDQRALKGLLRRVRHIRGRSSSALFDPEDEPSFKDASSNNSQTDGKQDTQSTRSWQSARIGVPFEQAEGHLRIEGVQQNILSLDQSYQQRISAVAWSPDGKFIAFGGEGGKVCIRYAFSDYQWHHYAHPKYRFSITSLTWSPDSHYLASGWEDGLVEVWDVHERKQVISYPRDAPSVFASSFRLSNVPHARGLSWAPDGRRIASSFGQKVYIWEALTGETVAEYRGHTIQSDQAGVHRPSWVYALAWSPNGNYLVSTGGGLDEMDNSFQLAKYIPRSLNWLMAIGTQQTHIWEVKTQRRVDIYPFQGRAVSWSPNGEQIAFACQDNCVRMRSLLAPNQNAHSYEHSGCVHTVAWSPSGKYLAAGGENQTIRVWQPGKNGSYTYHGHTKPVLTLAWSPEGDYIVSGGTDQTVQVWKAPNEVFG